MTIVTTDVRMGYAEFRYGILGHSMFLPYVVPMKVAKELMLTGREVPAQEAKELGLVNTVVEPDELAETTRKMATLMARMPPEMQKMHKTFINRVYEMQGVKTAAAAYLELEALVGAEPEPVWTEFMRVSDAHGIRAAVDNANARYEGLDWPSLRRDSARERTESPTSRGHQGDMRSAKDGPAA